MGQPVGKIDGHTTTGWWFGTCFIFPYIGNSNPNRLSYFSEGRLNHQPVIVFNSSKYRCDTKFRNAEIIKISLMASPTEYLMGWNMAGWWLSLPLWKKWVRQLGWWCSQLNGKNMFETTNQHIFLIIWDHKPLTSWWTGTNYLRSQIRIEVPNEFS